MAKYQKKRNSAAALWFFPMLLLAAAIVISLGFLFKEATTPEPPKIELRPYVTMEAGNDIPPAIAFLYEESEYEISYTSGLSAVLADVPGKYTVTLDCNGQSFEAYINVVDTTPPTGQTQDLTVFQTEMPSATDFVTQMQDVTHVTVSYLSEPDKNTTEPQDVVILLTDAGGNVTRLNASLTVIIDTEAPVIEGVKDFVVFTGNTLAYRSGVTVTDNLDSNILLDVDSSKVDLSTPGEYEVVYSATDFFGNTTSVTAKVTVYQNQDSYVELDVIYAEVDALLAKIITDDMNTRQQVQAIYKWVRNNCRYISHSEKDNWIQAGYRMLQDRKGDCYNYFGITKLMLERLEIPSIDVVKVPNYEGDSNHFWSLVSVDGGETYYHVDTTPRTVPTNFCLVTDKVMDDFSAGYRNCFNRDKSLYPATPLE